MGKKVKIILWVEIVTFALAYGPSTLIIYLASNGIIPCNLPTLCERLVQ